MESSKMEEIHPPQFRNIKRALQTGAEQFPEEIIEEILARLPVKSPLKFRCVSKSWRSLIGSQNFIKAHLENSTKNTNFTHHRVILSSFPPQSQSTLKHCSLYSLLNYRTTNAFDFDNSMFASSASVRVVGCCNGLVCILIDRRDFFLWKPSTRVSKKLPDLDHMVKHGHVTKYGFGFVAEDDDYKMFAFLSLFLFPGRYLGKRKVYSLKTDTWETVKDKDCSSPFDEAGKFAGGKLHWFRRFGLNSEWNIVWFDLKSNGFGTLELPNFGEGAHCSSLGVIDGCLCVLRNYGESSLDVWILKEYGVKESWCKALTIPYLWDSCECTLFSPLCIGPNRRTLFIYGSTPVIYNPKDNSFLHRQIVKIDEFCEPNVYVESLVLPFVDGGEEASHEMRVY